MKGDFSRWNGDADANLNGVLYQQGRVFLDTDGNAQTRITNAWQDTAGKDLLGAGVAAVPAEERGSFKIHAADPTAAAVLTAVDQVLLSVGPGRVWADGLLVRLAGTDPIGRVATYLTPPIQTPPSDRTTIADGVRDAVVLEVWRESLNAFQVPQQLIEPALGGPDTTERVHTAAAFRLLRLEPDDACDTLRPKLEDDVEGKGKLTVSLQPTNVIAGDCPVVEGGGFTGFEHQLHRIEIAEVADGTARFKWSRFNGGLVGRGDFDAGTHKVTLTANLQAIVTSRLDEFYLETREYDQGLGRWRLTYGAEVTLNNNNELVLPAAATFGQIPAGNVFFRLWDGIRPISDFPPGPNPTELIDGIRLRFQPDGVGRYVPEDYWTFIVRAGEVATPHVIVSGEPVLINDEPPEGIQYHRVPLAILNWGSPPDGILVEEIEDCRNIFQPLTQLEICCSFTVGDGSSSHGDFDSIEEALFHLPAEGGEICLLPGLHEANVLIEQQDKVKITGCGKQTLVKPRPDQLETPIFHVLDSTCITLEQMGLSTEHSAIVMEGTELDSLREIKIAHNEILAGKTAIQVTRGVDINISDNKIRLVDKADAGVALFLLAEDSLIERNDITVVPDTPPEDTLPLPPGVEDPPDLTDDCADLALVLAYRPYLLAYTGFYFAHPFLASMLRKDLTPVFKALGGIQIASGCRRVDVRENEVRGGRSNGITLGGQAAPVELVVDGSTEEESVITVLGNPYDLAVLDTSGRPFSATVSITTNGEPPFDFSSGPVTLPREIRVVADPPYVVEQVQQYPPTEFTPNWTLRVTVKPGEIVPELDQLLDSSVDITIERNEISHMGLSGIGAARVPVVSASGETLPVAEAERAPLIRAVKTGGEHVLLLGIAPTVARFAAQSGGYLIGLRIRDNDISTCLQRRLDDSDLSIMSRAAGLGGISLGKCSGLSVQGNRIHDNGSWFGQAVCGIFVDDGEEIEIADNYVVRNGQTAGPDTEDRGLRGGIRVGMAWSLSRDPLGLHEAVPSRGRAAARIHNNVVDQPMGAALTIAAIGPLSILDNRFNTDFAAPESTVGTVEVHSLNRGVLNEGNVKTIAFMFIRRGHVSQRWPGGDVLFNNNQTRFGGPKTDGVAFAQFIGSYDDVGFDGNHSDAIPAGPLLSNTLLTGVSVRATDSRFAEGPDDTRFSLVTFGGEMNMTALNQGDHCIVAAGPLGSPLPPNRLVGAPNMSRYDNEEECQEDTFPKHREDLLAALKRVTAKYVPGGAVHSPIATIKAHLVLTKLLVEHAAFRFAKRWNRETAVVVGPILELIADVELEEEISNINILEVADDFAGVHGRITDKDVRGIEGVEVLLKDPEERTLMRATTDRFGYYAMTMEATKVPDENLTLSIVDNKGAVLHRESKPVTLVAGDLALVEATLSAERLAFRPVPGAEEAGRPAPGRGESPNVLKIGGIGPKRAVELKKARITTVEEFLAASDETLRDRLGNVNLARMRAEAEELKRG